MEVSEVRDGHNEGQRAQVIVGESGKEESIRNGRVKLGCYCLSLTGFYRDKCATSKVNQEKEETNAESESTTQI